MSRATDFARTLAVVKDARPAFDNGAVVAFVNENGDLVVNHPDSRRDNTLVLRANDGDLADFGRWLVATYGDEVQG